MLTGQWLSLPLRMPDTVYIRKLCGTRHKEVKVELCRTECGGGRVELSFFGELLLYVEAAVIKCTEAVMIQLVRTCGQLCRWDFIGIWPASCLLKKVSFGPFTSPLSYSILLIPPDLMTSSHQIDSLVGNYLFFIVI